MALTIQKPLQRSIGGLLRPIIMFGTPHCYVGPSHFAVAIFDITLLRPIFNFLDPIVKLLRLAKWTTFRKSRLPLPKWGFNLSIKVSCTPCIWPSGSISHFRVSQKVVWSGIPESASPLTTLRRSALWSPHCSFIRRCKPFGPDFDPKWVCAFWA